MKEYDCVLCLFCLSGQEKDAVVIINQQACGKAHLFLHQTTSGHSHAQLWRRGRMAAESVRTGLRRLGLESNGLINTMEALQIGDRIEIVDTELKIHFRFCQDKRGKRI